MVDRRIETRTAAVYERNAAWFDATRDKRLLERRWLDRLTAGFAPGMAILDLGCGTGDPIARHFIAAGHKVTGLDIASAMIETARWRFPQADWHQGDMRDLAMARRFDGIIGWNSFFHLTQNDQRRLLPTLCGHLAPAGRLMLTVGPSESEAIGAVGGDPVYHASLSQEEYGAILADHGVLLSDFVREDPHCGGLTVMLAEKRDGPDEHRR